MQKLLSIIIKLMLVFLILKNIFNYLYSYFSYLNGIDILHLVIPFCLSILLFFFIWIKSNKISEIITGEINETSININYREMLSVVIISISLYLIIINFGYIINSFVNLFMLQYKDADKNAVDITLNHIVFSITSGIIEIIISLCLILFRRKIIKYFEKI
ncbi:MAG: hypothetical protein LBI28_07425 [Treponema sp.]|nr:hypothetical protein [Treponema sp.]